MSDRSKPEQGYAYGGQYGPPIPPTGPESYLYQSSSHGASISHQSHPHASYGSMPQHGSLPYNSSMSGPGFHSARSQGSPLIEMVSYEPADGSAGDPVFIRIRSTQDLAAIPQLSYKVVFKDRPVDAHLLLPSGDVLDQISHHTLSTQVPLNESATSPSNRFLWLLVRDEYGSQVCQLPIGDFTCHVSPTELHQRMPRDRNESFQPIAQPRRTPMQQAYAADAHSRHLGQRVSRPPSLQTHVKPDPSVAMRDPKSRQYLSQGRAASFAPGKSEKSGLLGAPGRGIKQEEMDDPSFPISAPPGFGEGSASQMAMHQPPLRSRQAFTVGTANPPLIRTSTLQPSPGPRVGSPGPPPSFNPYSIYPNNKANLEIEGDLDKMLEDWSEEELRVKRRLVEFERNQSGNTISTTFKPVTLEQRAPNSICVSCIWWERKGESFVTSVDTIYLLESLVAVRFTVEEKNRIRRNLEGFRPSTVAKGKPDSDDFFKVIMGFPNPKPRNIEKDVKVFPWRILKQALKKIIGKYSASYSSTAGTLSPPGPSYSGSQSHSAPESPSSTTSSSMSYPPPSAPSANLRATGQMPAGPPDPSCLVTPAHHQGAPYYSTYDPSYGYSWSQNQYGPPVGSQQYSLHGSFESESSENSQMAPVPEMYATHDPTRPHPSYGPYHYGPHVSQP